MLEYFLTRTKRLVVPAKVGTHQGFGYRKLCHMALLRRMGPRLRGDDSGESLLHILANGNSVDGSSAEELGPSFRVDERDEERS